MYVQEIVDDILKEDTPRYPYSKYIERGCDYYIFNMSPSGDDYSNRGIYYPNVTIEEVHRSMFKSKDSEIALSVLSESLKKHNLVRIGDYIDPILLTAFSVLHEEGHWEFLKENYINLRKNTNEFMKDYDRLSEEIGLTRLAVRCNKYKDNKKKVLELLEEYYRLYRTHPFEKFADNYAIEKIKSNPKFYYTKTKSNPIVHSG